MTDDWDPALRLWTLPYDPHLTEWLHATDPSLPSISAAREFGSQPTKWQSDARPDNAPKTWLEPGDLQWWLDPAVPESEEQRTRANGAVRAEIEELQMLMQDDRDRYLAEAEAQADASTDYIIQFIGADRTRHPWTIELISCGLAIGNVAYMYYKARYKRVRPSFLCPGLVPPLGPPGIRPSRAATRSWAISSRCCCSKSGPSPNDTASSRTRPVPRVRPPDARMSWPGTAGSNRRCSGWPSVSPKTASAWASTTLPTRSPVGTSRPASGGRCCTRRATTESSARPCTASCGGRRPSGRHAGRDHGAGFGGTHMTARPRLLSPDTSSGSGTGPRAQAEPVAGSVLARSAAQLAWASTK